MNRVRITVLFMLALAYALVAAAEVSPQFAAEVADTAEKVGRDTFNIVVYTDVHHDRRHVDPVDVYVPLLDAVGEVIERARIDAVWNLGDIINGFYTTKEEAAEEIRDVVRYEDSVSPDVHRVMGNHDSNIQGAGYLGRAEEELSALEVNELLENRHTLQTEVHSEGRPTDYYVDFPGIRVVCISAEETTFLPETAEWLMSSALKTSSPVLFFSHIPTRPEWGFHNDVRGGEMIEEAIRSFVSAGGEVIAYIHGHDHGDMISAVTDDDRVLWHEAAVACARFSVPKSQGTPGMTFWERNETDETMLVFDVVCVDLKNRKVRFVRFGAGEDREFGF